MCDFCKGEKDIYYRRELGTKQFVEIAGNKIVFDTYDARVEVHINYCPMCGERLEQ